MLPPLFPMTFFFSYGVNWYYACSKFTIRIFQLFRFQRTPMMFWGIPSRHRQSIIHSQWYHFLSFVHCAYIVARCSYIVKRFFLPVLSVGLPFSRESVASRVLNVRCSEFFHHAIRTCATDSIFRNRGGCLAAFRPCHPWLSILYHDVPTKSTRNLKFFGEKFCSHGIPYPRRVSMIVNHNMPVAR